MSNGIDTRAAIINAAWEFWSRIDPAGCGQRAEFSETEAAAIMAARLQGLIDSDFGDKARPQGEE
ncbi:MAG: hypothetical protein H7Z12_15145 [Rhodospirillaceae bacterium]|nr:hypothetical protein [Rhodospirillales bacterium]